MTSGYGHGRGRREKQARARELRRAATSAEEQLWSLLRHRQLQGLKFRRQAPLHGFIVDFYCPAFRMVLELDGAVHRSALASASDRERDAILTGHGLRVLRFTNQQLQDDPDSIVARILELTARSKASPSPGAG